MEINSPNLFIEINNSKYTFSVGEEDEQGDFKLIYKFVESIQGIENYKITNLDLVFKTIKLNFTFKDIILIINNFNCSFINLSGYKKLNGSQILKENITFILNSLKSNLDETEDKKTILHIFNTKYCLDKKKIEILPIGLFGDFYSHELSFSLINNNDYNNINNIFKKCNLKIKKILLKSFVEGSHVINNNKGLETFFQIKIDHKNSQLIYFENESLKFEQNFEFGSDIVINDIAQITSLKIDTVKKILNNVNLSQDILKDELIEKNLFQDENYIKIKKKLLFDIAKARIEELLEIIMIKNINLLSFNKEKKEIFFKINDKLHLNFFANIYKSFFLEKNYLEIKFLENTTTQDLINNANKLVHYGWKKEAIPVTHAKKSIIARFFDALFS
ncbi:cell division FtsA domain-containing protein [Candidatus Pelagibacter bacterium]|nr:cell division FtsA domain-containing protein [Candidatus Pelagibacter bacterium]